MLRQHLDAAVVPLQRRAKHWEEPSVEIELMDDDEYDMEEPVRKPRVRKAAAIFTGTKLSVSNLDPGVTETDVKDLFSDVGELKSYRLFDNGVAEVVYKSKQDAMDAINRYHGVPLDGKPMIIKNVDTAENGRGGVLDRLSTGPRGGGGGGRRRAASNHKDEWGDQESYCCFRMVGTDGVGMQEAVAWLTHALARPAEKRTQSTRRKRGMDDQAYRISASAKRKRNEVTL
jgi:RNA recognition motif-containing protein